MSEGTKKIIEINGIKMEVDLRTAKRIDTFKIGDPVKVLDTEYNNQPRIRAGVIIGFAEFQTQPTIEVMVLNQSYGDTGFDFVTISKDKKVELVHYNEYESLFSQDNIVRKFDREIEAQEMTLIEMKRKKKYFVSDFQKAFEQIVPKG